MQFGKKQPVLPAFFKSLGVAVLVSLLARILFAITTFRAMVLFLSLCGTILLAFSFSPQGSVPSQGSLKIRAKRFFAPERATPVSYNRAAFYLALTLLSLSFILNEIER